MTAIYLHSHRVSLIPAMRSEASEPRRTLLPQSESTSASTLRLCVRFFLTALLLILLPACGGENMPDDPDDPGFEEGIPTEIRITLSARSGNATRAEDEAPKPDGSPKDPTSEVELMHDDWWIVFIDKKNTVRVITQKDKNVTDRVKSVPSSVHNSNGSDPDGFEAETFKIILPSGTYRIYAFTNVPPKTAEQFEAFRDPNSVQWKHGTTHLTDILGENKFIPDSDGSEVGGMQWPSEQNIPLTGVMPEVIIKNTVEEAINIEVIRAVAKVEFAFTNKSTETITLKKLEFSPISKCEKISFVPNNDALGFGPNNKLITDKVDTGTLSFNLNSALTVADPSYTLGFYCNESLPHDHKKYKDNKSAYDKSKEYDDLYTGHFTIDLTVEKNGTTKTNTLYTKKITYINRNDWIRIPIEFSDWKIYWKLRAYPPIGGYPPVFDQDEDGTTLSATVTTGGEFELYPSKIMKGTQDFTTNVDWNKDVGLTVLEGSDLFITEPHLETDPNNANAKIIVGELDPKKMTGTAKVKIDFYLDASTNITEVRTCTFTIKRQNSAP